MPKRIIVSTVHSYREGKLVAFTPGMHVDFSAAELEDIKRLNPRAIRVPVNEDNAKFTDQELEQQFKDAAQKQADAEALARKEAQDRALKAKEDAEKEADRVNAEAAQRQADADREQAAAKEQAAKDEAAKKDTANKAAVANTETTTRRSGRASAEGL